MRVRLIPALLAVFTFAAVGQDANQQPLPAAPSATKYPPKPAAAPASAVPAPSPTQTPAPAPAPASPGASATDTAPSAAVQAAASGQAEKPAAPTGNLGTLGNATQQPASAADQEPQLTTIVKQVDEVNVVFTVTDKRGKFVTDLKKDDFRVLDDGKPAQSIRSFRAETNLPLRVGLLVDASNSIRDRFKFEQEAAIEFLNQIIHQNDEAFVMGFDTTPEVTQSFTGNTEALSKGVRMLRPGEDNQSRVSREEAVEMAQKAGVIIYTISTNTSGTKLKGDKVLEHFAEETGGRAFFPFKIADVSDAFSMIQDELRSQYAIAYKPADLQSNGKYHSIQILADNKKYKVRARKGYYAPLR